LVVVKLCKKFLFINQINKNNILYRQMSFTSKQVVKKLPLKFNLINKLTHSNYFLYGILFLSILRLIKFYKENNVLCLGIFIVFILLFVNKKSLGIKTNLGKKMEMSIGLLTCVCITTLLCYRKSLIEGNTGSKSEEDDEQSGMSNKKNNAYDQGKSKCEEIFKKPNETKEELELVIDTCKEDIEKLEKKEKTSIGEMKTAVKKKIKELEKLKIQLENKKKLLDVKIKKEKMLEKTSFLISPPELMTGGNRPIPAEDYLNPLLKEKKDKNLESVTSMIEITKIKHDKKIPEVAFEEKGKIISNNEANIGASNY